MFKQYIKASLLFTVLVVTGCSSQPHKIWFQSTDSLVSQGNYKKALMQLTSEGKKETALYSQIQNKSNSSSQSGIKSVKKLINKKDWGQAKEKLNNLISFHPWNSQFKVLSAHLESEKADEIRLLKTQFVLAEAQLLQAKLLKYEFDVRNHDSSSNWSFKKLLLQNKKKEIAQSLYKLSVSALQKLDYQNAQRTYSQALALDNGLGGLQMTQSIHNGINKKSKNTILKKQNLLLQQLNSALDNNDYNKVITLHGILSNAPFKGREVNSALKKANTSRLNQAYKIDNEADSVYRNGNIKEAIALWKQAKLLAPSLKTLQEKLSRAEKVNAKLIHLRQQTD